MKFYPQLNVKSVYNFQNSLIKIDDYIHFAKKHQFKYLFYFENMTMYGVAEFIKKCQNNHIQPIIGLGIEIDEHQFINVVPINMKGYQNICQLSSMLNIQQYPNMIAKLDLIKTLIDNNNLLVHNLIDSSLFDHMDLTNIYNLNQHKVFCNHIRYFDFEDKQYFTGLYALKNGLTYKQAKQVYQIDESYPDSDEVDAIFVDTNTILATIAKRSFADIFTNSTIHFGQYATPNNIPAFEYLKQKCLNSLKQYFQQQKHTSVIAPRYLTRLETELNVIKTTRFADYFLIVYDYVAFAKQQNILVGPGRGSAAGSLVAFLLQITAIDPLEYGLLFERFLNPERVTMPDIDIDFQDDRRNEVIEYLYEKYGKYHVATIVTYQTVAFKSAFRDACRVYEVDLSFVNMISKLIEDTNQDFMSIITGNEIIRSYADAEEYASIFALTKRLIGIPRQTGTHAAGVVIVDQDLRQLIPIREGAGGIYQTQFDMNYLEDLGLIKMDLLGLRNLTILQQIVKAVNQNYTKKIKLSNINLTDSKVYKLLNKGETTGIFQLESDGMTDVVRKMQVNSIDDIAVASSLFRPGPQEMIPQYIANKSKPAITYLDRRLQPILQATFGIIVYQEQVMQIFQTIGCFSLGKADIVRRAIGKKQIAYMHGFKQEFIDNATHNQIAVPTAQAIWNWIEKFANYGFNKSHAIAYSLIGYWLAWFKTYYPAEFYAALLNNVTGNKYKMKLYLQQLKKYGVEIVKPSIKYVNRYFIGRQHKLYMPLTIIQNIGLDFIYQLRQQAQAHNDLFDDLNSFLFYMKDHGLTEHNYDGLAKSGAFDCFGYNNLTMFMNKQFIFGILDAFNTAKPISKQQNAIESLIVQPDDVELQANYEKEVFGFYIHENPIGKIKIDHAFFKPQDIEQLDAKSGVVNLIGQIIKLRTINDKNGHPMAFIELLDDTGAIDITIFAKTLAACHNDLHLNHNYVLEVRIQDYNSKITGILNKIIKPIK